MTIEYAPSVVNLSEIIVTKKNKKKFTCVLSVIGRPPPRYENRHVGLAFFDKSPRSGAFTRIVKYNNNIV